MTSNVIVFPNDKTCYRCEYVMMGPFGFYCSFYQDEYTDDKIAEECAEFKPY